MIKTRFGQKHSYAFEAMDKRFVRTNHKTLTNKELASAVGCPEHTMRKWCHDNGLVKIIMEYWTPAQVKYLLANYKTKGDKELAKVFNRKWKKNKGWTLKHIEKKRLYLGLKRSREELLAIKEKAKKSGSYRRGLVKTWDKRGRPKQGEVRFWRNVEGRFIPWIKIGKRFIGYARYMYGKIHGKVEKGKKVMFKDGSYFNLKPDNLILVTPEYLSDVLHRASVGLSDNFVAFTLTPRRPDLREAMKQHPELIELKRQQINLKRQIRKHGNNYNKRAA